MLSIIHIYQDLVHRQVYDPFRQRQAQRLGLAAATVHRHRHQRLHGNACRAINPQCQSPLPMLIYKRLQISNYRLTDYPEDQERSLERPLTNIRTQLKLQYRILRIILKILAPNSGLLAYLPISQTLSALKIYNSLKGNNKASLFTSQLLRNFSPAYPPPSILCGLLSRHRCPITFKRRHVSILSIIQSLSTGHFARPINSGAHLQDPQLVLHLVYTSCHLMYLAFISLRAF